MKVTTDGQVVKTRDASGHLVLSGLELDIEDVQERWASIQQAWDMCEARMRGIGQ